MGLFDKRKAEKELKRRKKEEEERRWRLNDLWRAISRCFDKDRFSEALPYLETCVSLGDAHAIYILGRCYLIGKGCEPDPARAVRYFSIPLDWDLETRPDSNDKEGHNRRDYGHYCLFELGLCYLHGKGVEQDTQRGADLMSKGYLALSWRDIDVEWRYHYELFLHYKKEGDHANAATHAGRTQYFSSRLWKAFLNKAKYHERRPLYIEMANFYVDYDCERFGSRYPKYGKTPEEIYLAYRNNPKGGAAKVMWKDSIQPVLSKTEMLGDNRMDLIYKSVYKKLGKFFKSMEEAFLSVEFHGDPMVRIEVEQLGEEAAALAGKGDREGTWLYALYQLFYLRNWLNARSLFYRIDDDPKARVLSAFCTSAQKLTSDSYLTLEQANNKKESLLRQMEKEFDGCMDEAAWAPYMKAAKDLLDRYEAYDKYQM